MFHLFHTARCRFNFCFSSSFSKRGEILHRRKPFYQHILRSTESKAQRKFQARFFSIQSNGGKHGGKFALAALAIGCLALCFWDKKSSAENNKTKIPIPQDFDNLQIEMSKKRAPITPGNPCQELALNNYARPADNLQAALHALVGPNGDKLYKDGKIDYDILGRVVETLEVAISNPGSSRLMSDDLAWNIKRQMKQLAFDSYNQGHLQQIQHPVHPRTYLIQRMIELWFLLPNEKLEDTIYWDIQNPHTQTTKINTMENSALAVLELFIIKVIHAGPYCFQPVPLLNAAALIRTVQFNSLQPEADEAREKHVNSILNIWANEFSDYPYGPLYSLPHLIVGAIQSPVHIFGLTAESRVATAAVEFRGVLMDEKFTKKSREQWFQMLIDGKFGGKSKEWFDSLVQLHNKNETPALWKSKIHDKLISEARAGWFYKNPDATTALKQLQKSN